ncbi:MAG: ABC transporter permease [archaeon]
MIKDYLNLSYSSLIHRGLRSWLTIIGILIGIAAVISLISLGEGMRAMVTSQFSFLGPDILTIQASGLNYGPPGSGSVNPLKEDYIKTLESVNGVEVAVGRNIKSATIEFNSKADSTFIGSMPSGEKRKIIERTVQLKPEKGRLLKDSDTNAVVLGNNYGKEDRFGKAVAPGNLVVIQGREFEVTGILKKTGSFTIDGSVLMNDADLEKIISVNDTYSVIVAKVSEGSDVADVKAKIEEALRKERDVKKGEEDFSVQSAQQALSSVNSILFAIQIFISVIAGISIVVGGIGIANTMYTSVTERTKQIGIMKSIGAKNRDIFLLFLFEAGLLGLVGGFAGIAIGLGLAYGLAYVGTLALNAELIVISTNFSLVFGALLFSFVIGCVSGILPAMQASRLKPVDALRSVK